VARIQGSNIFEQNLDKNSANFTPLTPLNFLPRAASIYPNNTAVIYDKQRYSYQDFHDRCCRLARALKNRGIGLGDTVSLLAPNTPPMLEAHFGVPMSGAVLNALNYRLDGNTIAAILDHAETNVFDL